MNRHHGCIGHLFDDMDNWGFRRAETDRLASATSAYSNGDSCTFAVARAAADASSFYVRLHSCSQLCQSASIDLGLDLLDEDRVFPGVFWTMACLLRMRSPAPGSTHRPTKHHVLNDDSLLLLSFNHTCYCPHHGAHYSNSTGFRSFDPTFSFYLKTVLISVTIHRRHLETIWDYSFDSWLFFGYSISISAQQFW